MNNFAVGDTIEVIYHGSKHFRRFCTVVKVGRSKLTVKIGLLPGRHFVWRDHAIVTENEGGDEGGIDSSSEDGSDDDATVVGGEPAMGLNAQMKNLAITAGTLIALDGRDKEGAIILFNNHLRDAMYKQML